MPDVPASRADDVVVDVDGGVAHVVLNRPDAANGMDLPFLRALYGALLQVHGNPRVRCVLLTGAGRNFCAGGDVGDFASKGEALPDYLREADTGGPEEERTPARTLHRQRRTRHRAHRPVGMTASTGCRPMATTPTRPRTYPSSSTSAPASPPASASCSRARATPSHRRSRLCRVVSNVEIVDDAAAADGEIEVAANFVLYESRTRGLTPWVGRSRYRLRPTADGLRLAAKTVYLVDNDQPMFTLAFLI